MRNRKTTARQCVLGWMVIVAVAWSAPAWAQEETAEVAEGEETVKPWSNEAEASYVKTSGNSSSSTFAVSNRFAYNFTYSEFLFTVDLLRASTTIVDRSNVDGELVEDARTETSAERYEVVANYRHNILDNMFWFVGGNWYRNRFAGVDSRAGLGGGVGYRFVETPTSLFVGQIGAGVTSESLTNDESSTFVELTGELEAKFAITSNTDFAALFELGQDLQNTDNLRFKLDTSITAAMSNTLALRVGYLLDYRNDPVVEEILGGEGVPPVFYTRDKSDSMFLVSLVVKL